MQRDKSGSYAEKAENRAHRAPGVRPIQPVNLLGKMRLFKKNQPPIITKGRWVYPIVTPSFYLKNALAHTHDIAFYLAN